MTTNIIVRHCAPTLAGIKCGNLFSCKYENLANIKKTISSMNRTLNPKGVYLVALRICLKRVLIFVYRKDKVEEILETSEVQNFMKVYGYEEFSINSVFSRLRKRLAELDFPHEIGILLGYPLLDIEAFIENKGKDYKCVGCWKVYGNEEEARKTFQMYDKCKKNYLERVAQGTDINRLTVSVRKKKTVIG